MRKLWAIGAVWVMLAVGACGDNGEAGGTSSGAPLVSLTGRVSDRGTKDLGTSTQLQLELDDSYFAPTYVKAKAGAKVSVELENEGEVPHTFTIEGAGIDQEVRAGQKATVEVTLPASGSLAFYCRFHKGDGMQGAFAVS